MVRIFILAPFYAGLILLAAEVSATAGLAVAVAGGPLTLHIAGLGLRGQSTRGLRKDRLAVTIVSAVGAMVVGLAVMATVLPLLHPVIGAWSLATIPPAVVALHRIGTSARRPETVGLAALALVAVLSVGLALR